MDFIVTKNQGFFEKIGKYNYCTIAESKGMLTKGIGLDTETSGLKARKDKIFAMQIGTGKDNFLYDLQDYSTTIAFREYQNLTTDISEVLPLLEGRHLVIQNAMFDLAFLAMEGFFPDPELIYDPMLASICLYNGKYQILHGFGPMMERELGIKLDKSVQKNIHRVRLSTDEAIQYCFHDVDRLMEVHGVLYEKLKAYGGHKTYHTNRKFLPSLVYTELCGLPVNEFKWRAKMERDQLALKVGEREVTDYIWENLPEYRTMQMDLFSDSKQVTRLLSSPVQMIPVFQKLGIDTVTDDKKSDSKKGKRGESKEDKALRLAGKKNSIEESVISLSNHEFVKIWLKFKDAQHKCQNFGKNILDEIEDSRLYVNFRPAVDTSRISARKEGAMNSLNIPADSVTRDCFEATKGHQFIVCDYEGQENVCLADQSLDPIMIASVVNDLDLHCAFARLAFKELEHLSDDDIRRNHKEKRTFVKSPRFLKAYGGSAYTMSKQCGMTLEQATFLSEKYDELHPGVLAWGQKVLEQACKTGYLESADCWRLHLPDFAEFKATERKLDGMTRDMWKQYRIGKEEYKMSLEFAEQGKEYEIEDQDAWDVYSEWRGTVRRYWKKRGEYYRLSLNFPIQSRSAHQSKRAMTELYKYILSRGHLWKARIVNFPYDEIDMEVVDELVPEYKEVLGRIMRESGDYYLESGLLKMKADANSGSSWHTAK